MTSISCSTPFLRLSLSSNAYCNYVYVLYTHWVLIKFLFENRVAKNTSSDAARYASHLALEKLNWAIIKAPVRFKPYVFTALNHAIYEETLIKLKVLCDESRKAK